MPDANQSVGGLTEEQIQKIRQVKGKVQQQCPDETITNADAIMWAINNELEE